MATGGKGRLTPAGRFAVRVGILALVAALGGLAHGVAGLGDDDPTTAGSSPSNTVPSNTVSSSTTPSTATPSASSSPATPAGDPSDAPNDAGDPSAQPSIPAGGVPSGVTGGVGDDVRLTSLQVYAGPGAAAADLVAAGDRLRWNAQRFSLLASGNEYGTRSVLTARGLEARRILWFALHDRVSGVPVSVVVARYETGTSEAVVEANAAYRERVDLLVERLSQTATVILTSTRETRSSITVPDGNAHPGVVLAVRERVAAAGGQRARISVQAPGGGR